MASSIPFEGLDQYLSIFPKNGTNLASTFLGFFTSQTGSTVPAQTATGGATPSGWTEATGTNYARPAIAAGSWGANVTQGTGRRTTAGQVTFNTVGAGGWGTLNGVVWTSLGSSQAGDIVLGFANFSDTTPIVTTENDIVRVTPSFQGNGQ